ncbi:MAG: histidine kinase dimerization/phospho-acceptor domain-containing protein, partial [Candidatus Eremiobacterota bacterium]
MRRFGPWLLLALTLVAMAALVLSLLRRMESDALEQLELEMVATARAMADMVAEPLASGQLDPVRRLLRTTQNATGSRIRLLNADGALVADSLGVPAERQESVPFRPEVEEALKGRYAAYTRLSDETDRSLALFAALPVYHGERQVGVVYVSHSTDRILQQLGAARRTVRYSLTGLTFALFCAALYLSRELRRSLGRLGRLAQGVAADPQEVPVEGSGEVALIGEGINRLVASLREQVALLEDEKRKTRAFLEEVAHELKTPITGLCGSVEALSLGPDPDTRDRLLRNIDRESRRLAELTSRLLELQRLEYDRFHPEPFDLTSLLETVVDSYEHEA